MMQADVTDPGVIGQFRRRWADPALDAVPRYRIQVMRMAPPRCTSRRRYLSPRPTPFRFWRLHRLQRGAGGNSLVLVEHARNHAGERGGVLLRVVYGGVENYGLAGGNELR